DGNLPVHFVPNPSIPEKSPMLSARVAVLSALFASFALPAAASPSRDAAHRDFNGDGRADLLWQSPSQGVAGWLMEGTAFRDGASFPPPGTGASAPPMTGDFDGDGRTDLLWRSATDDRYDVRLMN